MIDRPDRPTSCGKSRSLQSDAVRVLVLLSALMLGSCNFLLDEFTVLDKPGPVAEPQLVVPSGTSDRH